MLVKWRNENWQWFFSNEPVVLSEHLKWYSGVKRDKTQTFYIIKTGREPVGTISLALRGLDGGEYGRFLIAAPHRKQGYGEDALKTLCRDAFVRLRLARIYGDVLSYNKAAIALAKKLGFQQVEGYHRMIYRGDIYWPVMRLVITAERFKKLHDPDFDTE